MKKLNKWVSKGLVCIVMWIVIFSLGISPAVAESDKLSFGLETRLRFESQNDFNLKYYGPQPPKGEACDGFLLSRIRAGFDYRPNETLHLALWVQDARIWGSGFDDRDFYSGLVNMEHNPNEDRCELWETYLEIKNPFTLPLVVKAGRQRMLYGDKRVFGPGAWGNSGKWIWDAVKLTHPFKKGFVDVFYGRTMVHEPIQFSFNHRHFYESLGTYGHFTLPEKFFGLCIEPFSMTKRDTHRRYVAEDGMKGDLNAAYVGMRMLIKNLQGFDLDATYIREFGDFSSDTIRAYGYHLLAAYTASAYPYRPRVSLEYSVGSGDHDPNDSKYETFDGAFGARDKMYGRMNLFRWQNIRDAQINLELHPRKWMYCKAEFHRFWLDDDKDGWSLNRKFYRDKTGNSGNEVGKEFDFIGRFDFLKGHQIQVGYGHFWPDEFAEKQASNKQADWFFLQWQYQFSWGIL